MIRRPWVLAGAVLAAFTALPSFAAEAIPASAAPVAAEDPARLAAAQTVAATVFPDGTYKRIMGQTMSKLMDSMMGSMMNLPMRDIVGMTGVSQEKISQLSAGTTEEVASIIDPNFRKRMSITMDTMFTSMGDFMSQYEPRLRGALTRSFARKFDLAELTAIRTFFATPAGNKFAGDYMTMFLEPEIMGEMQGMMPELMKKMPELIGPAMKASASLPPPRKIPDLSNAEIEKLATLLGMDPADLKKAAARAKKEDKQ